VKSLKAQEALKQENTLLIEQKEVLQHRIDHLTVREYECEIGLYLCCRASLNTNAPEGRAPPPALYRRYQRYPPFSFVKSETF